MLYHRLVRAFPTGLFISIFLISAFLSGRAIGTEALGPAAIIFFLWHFAVVYNDLADRKIDRITSPLRPLVRENGKEAGWIMAFDAAAALAVSVFYGLWVLLLTLAALGVLFGYSCPRTAFKRSRFATLSQGAFAAICAAFGILLYTRSPENSLLVLVSFVLITLFSVVKDFKDVKGDRKDRRKTLPLWLGREKAAKAVQLVEMLFIPVVLIKMLYSPEPTPFLLALTLLGIIVTELFRRKAIGPLAFYKIGIVLLVPILLFAVV